MGNVYMEADQVRFKDSTYRNVQEGLAAALEGGGGGGTTVVANPEGSATADLAKLQVGTTIYGIPETAAKVTYDNTSSGLTADDVQEAIDELNTGLSGVTELIPSGATTSNKLATESDIPDAVTGNPSGSATAGNLTKLQIGNDIYNVPSGGGIAYSTTETLTGDTWTDGKPIYCKVVPVGQLPATPGEPLSVAHNVAAGAKFIKYDATIYNATNTDTIPFPSLVAATNGITVTVTSTTVIIKSGVDRSEYTSGHVILYYTKAD